MTGRSPPTTRASRSPRGVGDASAGTVGAIDEVAPGVDESEASLAWLKDIQARMAEAEGTEALIEGFGELSGRFQKSV